PGGVEDGLGLHERTTVGRGLLGTLVAAGATHRRALTDHRHGVGEAEGLTDQDALAHGDGPPQTWAGRTTATPDVAARTPDSPTLGTVYPQGSPVPVVDRTGAVSPARAVR